MIYKSSKFSIKTLSFFQFFQKNSQKNLVVFEKTKKIQKDINDKVILENFFKKIQNDKNYRVFIEKFLRNEKTTETTSVSSLDLKYYLKAYYYTYRILSIWGAVQIYVFLQVTPWIYRLFTSWCNQINYMVVWNRDWSQNY